ncbi:MAG: helix-turn-helix transcriptional regulator, partial [Bacteroidales bacterium]|nr:helix-turn-helix transcriptional regulator [Bacteroidales bacterium]
RFMNLEMWASALLIASLILSLFIAIVLFSNKKVQNCGGQILGVFMIFLSAFLLDYALVNGDLGFEQNLLISVLLIPIALSLQPLVFLYVLSLTGLKKSLRSSLIHFIPSVLSLSGFIFLLFFLPDGILAELLTGMLIAPYPEIFPQGLRFFLIVFNDISFFLQIPLYVILILLILSKHRKRIRDHYSNIEGISLSWFQVFIIVYMGFLVSILVVEYLLTVSQIVTDLSYIITTLIFIAFLGYFGIRQQDVVLHLNDPKPVYFNKVKAIEMEISLKQMMDEKKPYLDTNFTISVLASLMKTNRMYVSVLLNDYLDQSFYSLINNYRIEEAMRIMKNSESMRYSIEGIAHSVGFKSKSTFIKHFREKTGLTPGKYRLSQE